MRRTLASGWIGALLLVGGCATGPLLENPMVVHPAAKADCAANPVYVPFNSAPQSYAALFAHVLDVIGDYGFDIAYSNRYEGRVETFPRISPGLGQPWKYGSPDFERASSPRSRPFATASSCSSHRQRRRLLHQRESLQGTAGPAWPSRATAGAASFRSDPSLERQYEVIETGQFKNGWIPIGEDLPMEQAILDRLVHCDPTDVKPAP